MWQDFLELCGRAAASSGNGWFLVHITSDLLIGLAYAAIPFGLVKLVRRERRLHFNWVFWGFAVFICLCGVSHWAHIYSALRGWYGPEAIIKTATALASLTMAGAIWPIIPQASALFNAADEDRARRVEQLETMVGELNHRVKNTLTTILSLSRMTLRGSASLEEFEDAFDKRLLALSRAHNVLTETGWVGGDLRELLTRELSFAPGRIRLVGPDARLTAPQTVALAMAVHELATNAIKHGAFAHDGALEVTRTVDADALTLRWSERGPTDLRPPSGRGFGTRLIRQTIEGELGGACTFDYRPRGLLATFTIPLAQKEMPLRRPDGSEPSD